MKKNIFFLFFLVFLFSLTFMSAHMPVPHKLIQIQSLEDIIDSEYYKICKENPSTCYAGNVLTDVGVAFYWLEGEKYEFTHAPSFCSAMLAEAKGELEESCAIGSCMHQASDLSPHNNMVPISIKNSKLINYLIHVPAEQKVDNFVQESYPNAREQAMIELDSYDKCMPLFKRVMLGGDAYSDYTSSKLDNLFDKFISEIQTSHTGYDTAFKTKSAFVNISALPAWFVGIFLILMITPIIVFFLLVFKVIKGGAKTRHYIAMVIFLILSIGFVYIFVENLQGRGFAAVINIIKPVSNLVPLGDSANFYIQQSIDDTRSFLYEGKLFLNKKQPTGLDSLTAADRSVLFADYILFFVVLALFSWYLYYLFKKNKVEIAQFN